MINGAHVVLYSQDAEADRAFLGDVLGFSAVDAGGGWLIFKLPPAEVAVHPTADRPQHEFYLLCDDLEATLAAVAAKGFVVAPIDEQRWGRLSSITLPSGAQQPIYQPLHPVAHGG
ncbi:catechol 2,3-dioxygenase-like lactoylglutathione lyase family enzyme [Kitasatospora sp. MAP12-15]|uniref:VOC family protein n=1 Tax=unclassified Kitasatospora TaxID=2633591 RepID=UPI0024731802|nr:VOC family protein [Kitasatospora sp. MAP12-44]MDH6108782.1 catechol 2,3-dioxygenase-like lactoylglutathione lyase family enzyme [Kitasatospora sp. MAP12-44]